MNQQSPFTPGETCTPERFLQMVRARPRDERWQLIDGVPVLMMSPPTGKHQKIAANLDRRLTAALEATRPDLDVLREIGLAIEAHPNFRPIADLAIVPAEVGEIRFFTDFHLAAEILSQSNTQEHISLKRRRYADGPNCLHVLIVSQDDIGMEVWSRSNGWQGRVFRSPEDTIALPEFGFSCRLGDLYRGTPVP